jgi:hypothetical protein
MQTLSEARCPVFVSRCRRASWLASTVAATLLSCAWGMGVAGTAQAGTVKTNAAPVVLNCGLGKGLTRPSSLTIACADGNSVAKKLTWSKWASSGATATGVYSWDPCSPTCAADSKWASAAATLTLSDVVHTSKGSVFGRLVVHITGKIPNGVDRNITLNEVQLLQE